MGYNKNKPFVKVDVTGEVDKRFDNVTSQLAETQKQKADKTELSLKRDKEVPIGLNDTDSELLSAIQGGSGTSFNLLSIPRDLSVTPKKTTFVRTSTNLFDLNSVTSGNIDTTTGEIINSSVASVTDFTKIEPNASYISSSLYAKSFYDETKTFISAMVGNGSFTTPPDTAFIRMSSTDIHSAQLNEGETLLPYEEYFEPYFKNDVKIKTLPDRVVKTENIDKKAVGLEQLSIVEKSSNLVDKENILEGYSLSGGEPVSNSSNSITPFIEIKPNTEYIGNFSKYALYNENKKFIGGGTGSYTNPVSFVTDTTSKYIRLVYYVGEMDIAQLNEGSVMLPYENYYQVIDPAYLPKGNSAEINLRKIDFIVKGLKEVFMSSPMDSMTNSIQNLKHTDIYAEYDALATAFPNYITATNLGNEESGRPRFRYDFIPQAAPPEKDFKRLKVFIVAGTHGFEKTAIWTTLQAMKQIAENWKSDPLLELLRWNVHFIIIPLNNPWGFDVDGANFIGERKNFNGVDLSRNMPTDWEKGSSGDPASSTYRGAEPLSEIASQDVYDILVNEKPHVTIDFHNFHTPGSPTGLSWIVPIIPYNENLAKNHISKMTREWKKRHSFVTQDESIMFGNTNHQGGGTIANEAVTQGSLGIVMEVSRRIEEEPNWENWNSLTFQWGVEFLINYLLLAYENVTSFYNN